MKGSTRGAVCLLAVAGLLIAVPGAGAAWVPPVVGEPSHGLSAPVHAGPWLTAGPVAIDQRLAELVGHTPVGPVGATGATGLSDPVVTLPEPPEINEMTEPGEVLASLFRTPKPIEALADVSDDEMGNPLVDFSYLSMGPRVFTMIRSGRPGGDALQWSHVSDSALSYVRPHRNLGFVMNIHGPEAGSEGLSGNLVDTEAQFIDNLSVDIDSRSMTQASSAFGEMSARDKKRGKVHPGRVVSFGIDLGLLPAVLADVGISTTVTVGRSENPGMFVSVATNIEVPNERTDELTVDSQYQARTDILISGWAHTAGHHTGGVSGDDNGGGGGGGGGGERIPITPVPEPSTMVLLTIGAAVIAARRRRNNR